MFPTGISAQRVRNLAPFALLAVALFLATAFSFNRIGAPANTVTLPIEVIPPDGASTYTESVTVNLSSASGVETLFLQGHALGYHKSSFAESNGYDQKASFRINGGAWVAISNANATCVGPARKYPVKASGTTDGCIGGPFHTLQLTVPVNGTGTVTSGDNVIDFRFNGTDGVGSGYRVIDIELRNSSGDDLIDGTTFKEVDYTSWSAPSGADASNGKQLWQKRNALIARPGGEPIHASCADCHSKDGRDLKYFNFSNRSIVGRSQFHGFSESQGKDIAAYIRSINLDLPSGYDVNDTGRPWNPPYQPGPGLDDKPVELWAAGAGVDWVLDSEREDPGTKRDMLTYLFPNGFNLDRIHPDSTLNNREMPLAVMLPDWNSWLPDVHPFDRYEEGMSGVQNARLWEYYQDLHDKLDTQSERDQQIQEARDYVGHRFEGGVVDLFSKLDNSGRKQTDGLTEKSKYSGDVKLDNLSLHQWLIVKQWEVNQMYKLEDKGHEVYAGLPLRLSNNDRMWLGNNNNLFDAGPHKNSRPEYPSAGPYPDASQNIYFTTAWYQMQMILNSMSNGDNGGGKPMDWNYHHEQGIRNTEQAYPGTSHWLRFIASQVQIHQDQSNFHELGIEDDLSRSYKKGWQFRATRPWRIVWGLENNFPDQSLVKPISDAVLRSWLEESERYARDEWPVSDGDDGVPDSDYTPTADANIGNNGFSPDHFYTMLDEMSSDGTLSSATLDRAADWGEMMWPNGNWEQWMVSQSTHTISLDTGWNLISSHVQPDDDAIESVFSGIESDLAIVQDQEGDSYDPALNDNSLARWEYTEGYRVFMNGSQTLSVKGSSIDSQTLSLAKGWNLIPYYPSTEMSVENAFSSIKDKVEIVKDGAGNSYIPDRNLDEIGTLKPGRAYKVYVSGSTSFSYP